MREIKPLLLHTTFLICFNILLTTNSAALITNKTDVLSLLAFKNMIYYTRYGSLSSWNASLHFCLWDGVICSNSNPQRVISLNLSGESLVGSLSPHISNLSFLSTLDLSLNNFKGKIPHEISHLTRLKFLNLSSNSLDGEIPGSLSKCKELKVLDLHENELDGTIPTMLGSLVKLRYLMLNANNFIGHIPPSLGNLSLLTDFDVSKNGLEGRIPDDLGKMVNLKVMAVRENDFSGIVPSSLFNLSSMRFLNLADNHLYGILPSDMGLTLSNLETLMVQKNHFSGPLPNSLGNALKLKHLDFSLNNFSGPVPPSLGNLQRLRILYIGSNKLTGDVNFITNLTNCTNLERLSIVYNKFIGVLPKSIANLSMHLTQLRMYQNVIYGPIPPGIDNLVNLVVLSMQLNFLTGLIPIRFEKLTKLQAISLHDNQLTGEIPASIGNLTRLFRLHLERMKLHGSIPQSLGNCIHLQYLYLFDNDLSGDVPERVLNIPSLLELRLSTNSLSGTLVFDNNPMKSLGLLDISNNTFSGDIPSSLKNCIKLEKLYMRGNFFQGTIPSSLSALKFIHELDLSDNKLSGQIPHFLEELSSLHLLNLSFNSLEGEVPKHRVFQNITRTLIFGNKNLCGGIPELQLLECPKQSKNRQRRVIIISLVVVFFCSLLFSLVLGILSWLKKSRMSPILTPSIGKKHLEATYPMLLKATNGFSSTNLLGEGSCGSVYKGYIECLGKFVAIKVLKIHVQRATQSFIAECEALRRIQHRNIIKILTVCSSVDFSGNEFKALVFEYMANGNLDMWIHPKEDDEESRYLNLLERIDIAIDVACALEYLHHHCESPIVHCDLKPSNVLLDCDMIGHIGDFGLTKILSQDSESQSPTQSTLEMKGSIGYIAPEYGMGGDASTYGDVYSFGILLLEMFTAKRPTSHVFKDNQNLHQFAQVALPERIMDIIDHRLLAEEVGYGEICNIRSGRLHQSLVSLISIGVSCSLESPKERKKMNDVVVELRQIRHFYLGCSNKLL